MGLTPHVQTTSVVGSRADRPFRAATVSNVWVRVPGRASTGTVLLAAHYDSVPTGPGACDDAASVAAILETLRALQARHGTPLRLRNDLLLLFTDGEEAGLLGARAFVESLNLCFIPALHPPSLFRFPSLVLAAKTRTCPEFRGARGERPLPDVRDRPAKRQTGASVCSGCSQPDGLLPVLRRVQNPAQRYRLYRVSRVGMRGLNFAFIDRVSHYHSALDNADRLDARSLQHQGDNMLGLAQSLGDAALTDLIRRRREDDNQANGDAIYFNYARSALIIYPETWAMPLAALATLLTIAFVIAGMRTGCFTRAVCLRACSWFLRCRPRHRPDCPADPTADRPGSHTAFAAVSGKWHTGGRDPAVAGPCLRLFARFPPARLGRRKAWKNNLYARMASWRAR